MTLFEDGFRDYVMATVDIFFLDVLYVVITLNSVIIKPIYVVQVIVDMVSFFFKREVTRFYPPN